MNDRMIMENYLLLLKSTTEVYVHGTLESSNQSVREDLKYSLDEIMSSQARTYTEMTNYDWYKVDNVEPQKITELLNKLNQDN